MRSFPTGPLIWPGGFPEALAPLARVAHNYRWAWYPPGKEVFRAVDARRWQICGENPLRFA